ncbi:YbhB/YbcL family Raf kinase inhibitor-like protein [Streptomyces sp. NPDC014846]|uniref:YbhB/YbcL family Raf kinase inhibitor-like protein n=1 Tax=Streptomyces sp. NPDC014846 TaxID=3364922 RepID=UPI0036FC5EB1
MGWSELHEPYDLLPGVPSFEPSSCDIDPDALTVSGFRHWAVYDIPASVHELSAGAGEADAKRLPSGARTSVNDAGRHGFLGAAPPPGEAPHQYMFVVHALDTPRLDITTEATPAGLGFRLKSHGPGSRRTAWHALTPVFGIPARPRSGATSEK